MENQIVFNATEISKPGFQAFVEFTPGAVAIFDRNMRHLACSDGWLGEDHVRAIKREEVIGRNYYDVFPEVKAARKDWCEVYQKTLSGESINRIADVFVRDDGEIHWINWKTKPWYDTSGEVGGIVIYSEIITEVHELRRYFEIMNDMLCVANTKGYYTSVNPEFVRVLAYTEAELLSRPIYNFVHPEDVEKSKAAMGALSHGVAVTNFSNRLLSKRGEVVWVVWSAVADPQTQVIYALARNVTKSKLQQIALAKQTATLDNVRLIQKHYIDGSSLRALFSKALGQVLSMTNSEYGFIGSILTDEKGSPYLKTYAITNVAWNEQTQRFYEENVETGLEFRNLDSLFGHTIRTGEAVLTNNPAEHPKSAGMPKGHPDLNAYLGLPIKGQTGLIGMLGIANRPSGYDEAVVQDVEPFVQTVASIIESAQNAKRLERLAHYDFITGLYNRTSFENDLKRLEASSNNAIALLYCDLDRFKTINDTLGHRYGDILLGQIAERLTIAVGSEGVVYRVGGDEFAILVESVSDTAQTLDLASQIVTAINPPFYLADKAASISCSVGIALSETVLKAGHLMQKADFALYQAKRLPDQRYQLYSKALSDAHLRSIAIENEWQQVNYDQEIRLLYQPQVCLETDAVVGFEVLTRWHSKSLGDIEPDEFIPICEMVGKAADFNVWLVQKVITDCQTHFKLSRQTCKLAVNVSTKVGDMLAHFKQLAMLFNESLLNASKLTLEFELTEGDVVDSQHNFMLAANAIESAGIHIAIDDFGVAYSSFSRLKQVPVNTIKIDRSFVKDMLFDGKSASILKSIICLSQHLDAKLVAEGVENEAQMNCLKEMGCKLGQGFYLYRPMPLQEACHLLQSQHHRQTESMPL